MHRNIFKPTESIDKVRIMINNYRGRIFPLAVEEVACLWHHIYIYFVFKWIGILKNSRILVHVYLYIYIQYNIFQSPGSGASRSLRSGFKVGVSLSEQGSFLINIHILIFVQYPTRTLGYCKLFSGEYQPCCYMYNCKSDVCSRE